MLSAYDFSLMIITENVSADCIFARRWTELQAVCA